MSREQFEGIVNKYTGYRIPEHISGLMAYASETVGKMLKEYARMKRKEDNLDLAQSKQLATEVGAAQGMMAWTDVMLGVEFADEILGRPPAENQASIRRSTEGRGEGVTLELDMEEWGVLDACIEASKQLILKKTKFAGVPLNRQESDVVHRIEDLQRVIQGAGEEAFNTLSQTKIRSTREQISAFNHLLISTYAGVEDAVLAWQIENWRGE